MFNVNLYIHVHVLCTWCCNKNSSHCVVVAGPVEADPEYKVIVEANNITVEIDNEISKLII